MENREFSFQLSELLQTFLGRFVLVENCGLTVFGKLIRFDLPWKDPHKPCLLVLQNLNQDGVTLIRGYDVVKEAKP